MLLYFHVIEYVHCKYTIVHTHTHITFHLNCYCLVIISHLLFQKMGREHFPCCYIPEPITKTNKKKRNRFVLLKWKKKTVILNWVVNAMLGKQLNHFSFYFFETAKTLLLSGEKCIHMFGGIFPVFRFQSQTSKPINKSGMKNITENTAHIVNIYFIEPITLEMMAIKSWDAFNMKISFRLALRKHDR